MHKNNISFDLAFNIMLIQQLQNNIKDIREAIKQLGTIALDRRGGGSPLRNSDKSNSQSLAILKLPSPYI